MKVLKFGGSCLVGAPSLARVVELLGQAGRPVVAVLSALQGVTDDLISVASRALLGPVDLAPLRERHLPLLQPLRGERRRAAEACLEGHLEELRRILQGVFYLQELSPRTRDRVLSFGERAIVAIAARALEENDLPVAALEGGDAGIITDSRHGDARILDKSAALVRERLSGDRAFLVAGFIGRDERGATTTLGRGGSDYTATFIGAALCAPVTLLKDVDGVMTADPKICPDARPIERLGYQDALELAHYGLKAVNAKAILPARRASVPIEIRGFERGRGRTVIGEPADQALAISCVRRAVTVHLIGQNGEVLSTLARLFDEFAQAHAPPLLVTEASPCGETSIVLTEEHFPRLEPLFRRAASEGLEVKVQERCGVVSVVGSGMRGRVGFAASIFQCLAERRVNAVAIAQTASERNCSVIVAREQVEEAVRALHARFVTGSRSEV